MSSPAFWSSSGVGSPVIRHLNPWRATTANISRDTEITSTFFWKPAAPVSLIAGHRQLNAKNDQPISRVLNVDAQRSVFSWFNKTAPSDAETIAKSVSDAYIGLYYATSKDHPCLMVQQFNPTCLHCFISHNPLPFPSLCCTRWSVASPRKATSEPSAPRGM